MVNSNFHFEARYFIYSRPFRWISTIHMVPLTNLTMCCLRRYCFKIRPAFLFVKHPRTLCSICSCFFCIWLSHVRIVQVVFVHKQLAQLLPMHDETIVSFPCIHLPFLERLRALLGISDDSKQNNEQRTMLCFYTGS